MAKKTKKKKTVKIDPLQYEKDRLLSIINRLDECTEYNKGNNLESYFRRIANLNRDRLRDLK